MSIMEQFWAIMKYCLSYEELLVERHLDQLVLCTMYSVCKVQHNPDYKKMRFNDIIVKYTYLQMKNTGAAKSVFQSIYTEVSMGVDKPKGSIIEFYNKIFLPKMKKWIMTLTKKSNLEEISRRPCITQLLPETGLKSNLPPSRLTYSTIFSS